MAHKGKSQSAQIRFTKRLHGAVMPVTELAWRIDASHRAPFLYFTCASRSACIAHICNAQSACMARKYASQSACMV